MKNRSGIVIAVKREEKSAFLVRSAILSALTGLALVAGLQWSPAYAQTAAVDIQRYSMEITDSGILRLDRQTGEIAICQEQGGKITCVEAKAEDLNKDARIAVLEKQVADLSARLSKLEKTGVDNSGLPSEEEFEKGLGYMERFMRSFMGIAKSLDEPTPNRT